MSGKNKATRVRETERVELEAPKTYLVTRPAGDFLSGKDKYVDFENGKGVLDLQAIFLERPDWVEQLDGVYIQKTGVGLSEYRQYWLKKGCTVEEITEEAADKFRAATAAGRLKRAQEVQAKLKARQKAKTKDREAEAPTFEAEAVAALNPEPKAPADKAPAGDGKPEGGEGDKKPDGDDKPPHENGAMEGSGDGTGSESGDGASGSESGETTEPQGTDDKE